MNNELTFNATADSIFTYHPPSSYNPAAIEGESITDYIVKAMHRRFKSKNC